MSKPHRVDSENWQSQLSALERDGRMTRPWVAEAVRWVSGSAEIASVIDVGSGPGFAALEFAQALPHASIHALDPTRVFVERAAERAEQAGVGERVSTHVGSIESGLSRLPTVDLVWSSHVVHHTSDPAASIELLRSQVHPGGRVAIAEGGLPLRVLPGGYGVANPSFLPRLEAALSDYYLSEYRMTNAAIGGAKDWPVHMADAGLLNVRSKTFLLDLPAPVDEVTRESIAAHYAHIREQIGAVLEAPDRAALDVLLNPADSRSLIQRSDLFVLTANTVHLGTNG